MSTRDGYTKSTVHNVLLVVVAISCLKREARGLIAYTKLVARPFFFFGKIRPGHEAKP